MRKKIINFYSINKTNVAAAFYFEERVGTHMYNQRNNVAITSSPFPSPPPPFASLLSYVEKVALPIND